MAMRNNKVVAIDFGVNEDEFVTRIEKQFDAPVYFGPDETRTALVQIQAYLDGKRTDFNLPTDISILTDFQQQVLQATQQIPRGRIATYMDIARKIGNPKAVRAVGQALGRNPIPIVIPCHRVIASNGSLGGYSGGGGLKTKAKLLQLEGAMAI
jgi:methylated-DNA-[protein]-cysteine S-methyltransferase